ncbi:MAG: hypothetical protein ACO1NY_10905 [Pseudorhodoplanes sp.]
MNTIRPASSDVAVVVSSFDGYADVWPGFFTLWFRFWPDCPYPVYLTTNRLTFPDDRVTSLQVGADLSWSHSLKQALEKIDHPTILLVLDDFFLKEKVDTARVQRLHAILVESGAACLRVVPKPPPDRPHPRYPDIGFVSKGAPYRTSLQIALWDRAKLLGLLQESGSAWDFEIIGSQRSDLLDADFLSVRDGCGAIAYSHTVRRGKWLPRAIREYSAMGIDFSQSHRGVESAWYIRWRNSDVRLWLGRLYRRFRPLR